MLGDRCRAYWIRPSLKKIPMESIQNKIKESSMHIQSNHYMKPHVGINLNNLYVSRFNFPTEATTIDTYLLFFA